MADDASIPRQDRPEPPGRALLTGAAPKRPSGQGTGAGARTRGAGAEHTAFEDAQAFALGTAMCALAVTMITHLGLITGQTAGAAVLLSYLTGWSFGAVFFVINLPFWALALARMGWRFTLKSVVAVALLSLMTEAAPMLVRFETLDPVTGALLIGGITGLGLIVLFRHGASLGGVGVLALFLQDRMGFRAGWTQLSFDALLFAAAIFVLEPWRVALSLLGAAVANVIVAVNHRKDRYIAT